MPALLRPGMALLPLRVFLGGTFVYGGIQKLSDPGYLHPGSSTYIGTQLHGFADGTPGGFILRHLALPHPQLAGVGVAIVEIVIGLLTVAGLLTRFAAAAGLGLNFLLFLTASWKTSPYFLGSDIVFVFAWLPFVLAGAAEQPALDHLIERRGAMRPAADPGLEPPLTRRALLGRSLAATAGAALGIAGISSLLKGSYRSAAKLATVAPRPAAPPAPAAGGSSRAKAPSLPQGAVRLGPSNRLPPGQAALYRDPGDGSPDILIRQPNGHLTALSAVCTHAGCQVGYQGGTIVCPCHGATYNAQTGAVESGPAPRGLAPRRVVERGRQIYAVPA